MKLIDKDLILQEDYARRIKHQWAKRCEKNKYDSFENST